jgi:hypothetical protein
MGLIVAMTLAKVLKQTSWSFFISNVNSATIFICVDVVLSDICNKYQEKRDFTRSISKKAQ